MYATISVQGDLSQRHAFHLEVLLREHEAGSVLRQSGKSVDGLMGNSSPIVRNSFVLECSASTTARTQSCCSCSYDDKTDE